MVKPKKRPTQRNKHLRAGESTLDHSFVAGLAIRSSFPATISTESVEDWHLAWMARYHRTLRQGFRTRQCLSHPSLTSNAAVSPLSDETYC